MSKAERPGIRWAEWILTAITLMVTLLLIAQCVDIYRVGTSADNLTATGVRMNDIYTPLGVARRFGDMAWALWLWVAALAAAIVCRVMRPVKKRLPAMPTEYQLWLTQSRHEETPATRREVRKRQTAAWVCGLLCLVCAVFCAVYLSDLRQYESDQQVRVLDELLFRLAPFALLAFAGLLACAQYREASLLRQIAAAKTAPVRRPEPPRQPNQKWRPYLRAALYLCALALLIAGILNGGMYDVLVKAVNLCTECVGLG